MEQWVQRSKGILLTFGLAVLAVILGDMMPIIGSAVFAIIFGMLVSNFYTLPSDFKPGINYSAKKLLHYSIIALGFTMSFAQVQQTGLESLQVTLVTIVAAFLTAALVGKWLGLSDHLRTLVGFGTAICGGSAIAAASPIIKADDEEIALSISTIFLFNIIAVFLFPFLGHVLQMTDAQFGLFAGTAINDTSSVVAAGYSYSQTAGDLATIVKLSRALMIVPTCLLFAGVRYIRSKSTKKKIELKKIFPWFILWFMCASLISSLRIVPSFFLVFTKLSSQWFMAMALVGIGTQVSFGQFKRAGVAPLLTGAFAWFVVAVTSLIIQYFFR